MSQSPATATIPQADRGPGRSRRAGRRSAGVIAQYVRDLSSSPLTIRGRRDDAGPAGPERARVLPVGVAPAPCF